MALKTSNKNRKKVEQQKIVVENKIFTKNYVIAIVLLTIFIFVFI